MEQTQHTIETTLNKPLSYYILLPIILMNKNENYYTIKYKQYIYNKKLLPNNIEITSINQKAGIIGFRIDETEWFNKIKLYQKGILKKDNNFYLFCKNEIIKDLIDIIDGKIDVNNKTLMMIFNFYTSYIRFEEGIIKYIKERKYDDLNKLTEYLNQEDENLYNIYMLSGIPNVLKHCIMKDLNVDVEAEDVLNNYASYYFKKELGYLKDYIK